MSPPSRPALAAGSAERWTGLTPESNAYGVAEGNQQLVGITDMGNPSSTNTDGFSSYWYISQFLTDQYCKTLNPGAQTPISQDNIEIKLP